MTVSEKIKTIGYKTEQSKGRYDLDRQTTKIFEDHEEMLVNMHFSRAKTFNQKKIC